MTTKNEINCDSFDNDDAPPSGSDIDFHARVTLSYAQLYRALVGIEPLARDTARSVTQMVGSLMTPVRMDRATRIERICAQIDADTVSTPASATPPMDYLNPDGSVTRIVNGMAVTYQTKEVLASRSVAAQTIDDMERAHEIDLGMITLERDGIAEELRILREKHAALVDECRRIDEVNEHDPSAGADMLSKAILWA